MPRLPNKSATSPSLPHTRHAFGPFCGQRADGVVVGSRRSWLKASMAGIGGLSLPDLMRHRAIAANSSDGQRSPNDRAVILLWMAGGPSHIDTWDMKPDRPLINRGPFTPISTAIPGVAICEHLPKQAAMLDRFTIIRSVDCRMSNHEPNMVMQAAHRDAEPRINPKGDRYPSMGSVIAKHRDGGSLDVPPYVAFETSRSHIGYGGYLGQTYDPFLANRAAKLPIYDVVGNPTGQRSPGDMFQFAREMTMERLDSRQHLLRDLDALRRELETTHELDAVDRFQRQAWETLVGNRIQSAFDLTRESERVRAEYGDHLWCQQALARRLVESGVAFVTIDLSYHPASGTWDNHGDNIPPYGGITRGLGPLLPIFDHLITTLVRDLEDRGLLDQVLVIAMGEFGRTPHMGTQGSTDGRDHWPQVMSMCLAGGGLRHGQVIGATDREGAFIKNRPVTPADLAATVYRHMGVPLDLTYNDDRGRPLAIVQENGTPLPELF